MSIGVGSIYVDIKGNQAPLDRALLSARASATAAATNINRDIGGISGVFKTLTANINPAVVALGGMAVGVGTVGAAMAAATRSGIQFESTMKTVQAVSRASTQEYERLEAAARKMGATTEWSASQSAEALKYMSMAGMQVRDSIQALPGMLDLATAAQMDLGRASDIVTDTLTAFGMKTSELTRLSDAFINVSTRSNTTVDMLGESFRYVAPIAAQMGYSVEQTAATLGILANAGIKASDAGTDLRQVMLRTAKAAKALGMDAGASLNDVLKEMRHRQLSANEVTELFGIIASKSAMVLMNNVDAVARLNSELVKNQGATKETAAVMRDTLENDLKLLSSAANDAGLEMFGAFNSELRELIQEVTTAITRNKEVFEALGEAIGGAVDGIKTFISWYNKLDSLPGSKVLLKWFMAAKAQWDKDIDGIIESTQRLDDELKKGIFTFDMPELSQFTINKGALAVIKEYEKNLKSMADTTVDANDEIAVSFIETWYLIDKASREGVDKAVANIKEAHAKNLASINQLTDAEIKGIEARTEAERAANDAYEKLQDEQYKTTKSAYDDMSDTIQDHVSDIISDWDNAGDMLVDIAKRTAAEMAAAFLTTNFVMPIALQVGAGLGMSYNGVSYSSMMGLGGQGATGTGWGLPSGNTLSWLGNNIPGMGYLSSAMATAIPGTAYATTGLSGTGILSGVQGGGVSMLSGTLGSALGYGALGSLGYGMLGLPQSPYSSITSGLGGALGGVYGGAASSALGLELGALAGPVGMIVGALGGGLIGSLFGGDDERPDVRLGTIPGQGLSPGTHDVHGSENRDQLKTAVTDYFNFRFDELDKMTSWSVSEAINSSSWTSRKRLDKIDENDPTSLFKLLIESAFTGDYARAEQPGNLRETLLGGMGIMDTDLFDMDFFENLTVEGEDLIQTFTRFAVVAEDTDYFYGRIVAQMTNFGVTAEEAFYNIEAITGTLSVIDGTIKAFGTSSVLATLEAVDTGWQSLIDTLEISRARTEDLIHAESGRNTVMGSQLTGLNTETLTGLMLSGDLSGFMADGLQTAAANMIAAAFSEDAMTDVFTPALESVGALFTNIGDMSVSEMTTAWNQAMDIMGAAVEDVDVDGLANALETLGLAAVETKADIAEYQAKLSGTSDAYRLGTMNTRYQTATREEDYNNFFETGDQANWINWSESANPSEVSGWLEQMGVSAGEFYSDMEFLTGLWTNAADDLAKSENQLTKARENAVDDIQDLINDLMGGSSAPVQSMEYFTNRYNTLYSAAQTANDPEAMAAASSAFTSFVPDYLDFAADFGGNYAGVHGSVVSDLKGLESKLESISINPIVDVPVTVNVKIGDQELREIMVDVLRNDPEAARAINRAVA